MEAIQREKEMEDSCKRVITCEDVIEFFEKCKDVEGIKVKIAEPNHKFRYNCKAHSFWFWITKLHLDMCLYSPNMKDKTIVIKIEYDEIHPDMLYYDPLDDDKNYDMSMGTVLNHQWLIENHLL